MPSCSLFRSDEPEAIRAAVEEAAGGSKKDDSSHQYRVFDLFKLPKPMRDAFGDTHGQYMEYLTAQVNGHPITRRGKVHANI